MSFWKERRKWHPHHFQNNTYLQGRPTQIHTDKQEKQTGGNNGTPLPEFYHWKFSTQNPIPKRHICVLTLCDSVLMFQSQDETMHSPSPVTTWNSRPLPNLLTVLLWPPAQWPSPQSWPNSQFFPPIPCNFLGKQMFLSPWNHIMEC